MGKVINISNKLDREPRFLVVDEKHRYKVDCSKNAVTKVMALDEDSGFEYLDQTLKILLGNAAFKEIEAMELPYDGWVLLVKAAIAVATNKDLEDVEDDFRKAEGAE